MPDITRILSEYFDSFYPKEKHEALRENRIDRMRMILDRLGHPERAFKTIHIAGSKGKGTTSYLIAKALSEKGHKTALFLSPHVYDIRERFSYVDLFFSDREYSEALDEIKKRMNGFEIPEEYGPKSPTTFEMYLSYALVLFREAKIEYAVIETGIGGRLDATNALTPIYTLITEIELEHTNILGDTIEKIAYEKGGIIKRGIPVFVSNIDERALGVIEKIAKEKESPLYMLSSWNEIRPSSSDTLSEKEEEDRRLALFSLYKMGLIKKGDRLNLSINLPARFEIRKLDNLNLIIDGAHTPSSIENLILFIEKEKKYRDLTLIFSLTEGKNIERITSILFPHFKRIAVTGTGSFKKSPIDEIYSIGEKWAKECSEYRKIPKPREAISWALSKKKDILITGSFYLASEIDSALRREDA